MRPNRPQIETTYDYTDTDGKLLYQVVRFRPKDFRQRRPVAGGWEWSLRDVPRVLYRLRDLLKADPTDLVFIVEGEKDADNLAELGLVATTAAMGAGKWRPEYNQALRGRQVVLLSDNDAPGHAHMDQVARHLHGTAASIRVLELPDLPDKGDVSDWLAKPGNSAHALLRLAQATPLLAENRESRIEDRGSRIEDRRSDGDPRSSILDLHALWHGLPTVPRTQTEGLKQLEETGDLRSGQVARSGDRATAGEDRRSDGDPRSSILDPQSSILDLQSAWDPPLPFGGPTVTLPAFPADVLPTWLRRWAEAEAEVTQTPVDLPALLALALCAGAVARGFRAHVRPRWTEPLNLFVVVALPPGERKSAVFADATAPARAIEQELIERQTPQVQHIASKRRILEQRLKQLEMEAAKDNLGFERKDRARKIAKVQKLLRRNPLPEPPQLLCDDATVEGLGQLLARQGGRITQASAEGTALEIAKGRYSATTNFDIYLKAHAGDPLRVSRIGRNSETVDQPALTLALAVQPEVIGALSGQASMKGRGFLARFLYSLPASLVGTRTVAAPPRDDEVFNVYQQRMTKLWRLAERPAPATKADPIPLTFTPEADAELARLERWLEPQLAPGAPLAELAGWANKLAGAVARIATVLHLAENVGTGPPLPLTVPAATVAAAVRLGRDYLLPHAQHAFGQMGVNARLDHARAVLAWLRRAATADVEVVSRRDVFNGFKNTRFKTVTALDPILDLLCQHGWLRPTGNGTPGRGRGHQSPTYQLHPALREP